MKFPLGEHNRDCAVTGWAAAQAGPGGGFVGQGELSDPGGACPAA